MPLIIIMQKFNNFCVTKSRLRPLQVKSIFLKPNESNNLLQHAKKHTFLLIFYTFFVYIFFFIPFHCCRKCKQSARMEFPFISQNTSPLPVAFESDSNVVDILLTDNFRTKPNRTHNSTCNNVATVVTSMPLEKKLTQMRKQMNE